MPKYLVRASYTAEGLKGLMKDEAVGRTAAVKKAISGVGGKLETVYWALGEDDVILIADLPDAVSAAALGMTVSSTGLVRTDELDSALTKTVNYRAPGK